MDELQIKRWRLILGASAEQQLAQCGSCCMEKEDAMIDEALAALYDKKNGGFSTAKTAGHGKSRPTVSKWLGDVRTLFPKEIVSLMQNDAIERKGLRELLFEPEILENMVPDIGLVSTLISLSGKIPQRTKDTARLLVRRLVEDIKQRLESRVVQAVSSAVNRRQHAPLPSAAALDFPYTIRRNLKNYDRERGVLIPERFYFFERTVKTNQWNIILDMDQSGSMAESVIYASIMGSILSSVSSVTARVVAFDTEVVDLTEQCAGDPVEMLFGIQLGGGTDINKSVGYCQQFVTNPAKTLFVLITDLYEGGNQAQLLAKLAFMKESGVTVLCLLALTDSGKPCYDTKLAHTLSGMGIPAFSCTPNLFPELLERVMKKQDISQFVKEFEKREKAASENY